mgnify:FL=1
MPLQYNNKPITFKPYDKRSFKPDVQRIPTGINNE